MVVSLFVLGIFLFAFVAYRQSLKEGYDYVSRAAAPVRSKMFPVPPYYRELLQKYFRYYQGLSEQNKRAFEQRVCRFIYSKKFIPRGMKEIPLEMLVFVAAVAVQITFGLPNVRLTHFNKILVYPDNYYSRITQRYHKGEVNPAFGIIVLSWTNFMEGFLHAEDAINLGLHEMAHALRIENIIRKEHSFFEGSLLDKLDEWCKRICDDSTGSIAFFRPYACTNVHEFFSVAVENFFERPQQFKLELPELYSVMVGLLNQDPIAINVNAHVGGVEEWKR
ncbi:MAG TPA: zinc-dependent peptidase [Cyclobacteriaceae bacterium]|nr:zinc-dependent peptidase [Cyclobacteriaceae bacterium]